MQHIVVSIGIVRDGRDALVAWALQAATVSHRLNNNTDTTAQYASSTLTKAPDVAALTANTSWSGVAVGVELPWLSRSWRRRSLRCCDAAWLMDCRLLFFGISATHKTVNIFSA
jgi:hypothetical protein